MISAIQTKKRTGRSEGPAQNWTKFPNSILSNIRDFNPFETQIICAMIWRTLGLSDPRFKFSERFLMHLTGISSRTTIRKYLEKLRAAGVICITKTATATTPAEYSVNWSDTKRIENMTHDSDDW